MKKLLLLLFLPLGLFTNAPTSIMSPTVYDLTGILEPGQEVVSMITDEGKLAEFKLNPDNNYLVIPTYGTFYYAAVADSLGNMSYLYLGPKSVVDEPLIQELPTGPTPVQAGFSAAGKGTALSWITWCNRVLYWSFSCKHPFRTLDWNCLDCRWCCHRCIWNRSLCDIRNRQRRSDVDAEQ